MVSLDPLYIVDNSMLLLDPAKNKFNTNYINRLRDIVIDKSANQNILAALPNEQIGLCLIYNFFNFRPVEYINTVLEEIFQKLRSGGTLIMTVNDCDRWGAVILAERNFACYTPVSMLVKQASVIGYNVVFKYYINSAVTWLELAKPGELTSIKGGQALSKILVRS
jgi:SAM-dependent methyltransferase